MEINVHEAKTHLSRLLQRVESGEEITIARAGIPVARLVPVASSRARAQGMDEGKIWMAADFDAPDPQIEALFYGAAPLKRRRVR
jgi:prevent-host-death family protein